MYSAFPSRAIRPPQPALSFTSLSGSCFCGGATCDRVRVGVTLLKSDEAGVNAQLLELSVGLLSSATVPFPSLPLLNNRS